MKKYLSVLITIVVLSLALSVSTSALTIEKKVTFSDDYKNLYFNGSTYVRADTGMLYYESLDTSVSAGYHKEYASYSTDCPVYVDYDNFYTIKLTDNQHKEINMVSIMDTSYNEAIFVVLIYFADGSELTVDFIREDIVDEYKKITAGNVDKFTIDFEWPDGNEISIDKEKFQKGNKTTIDQNECDGEFLVRVDSAKFGFGARIGSLYVKNDNYYFYNYVEAGFKSIDDFIENSNSVLEVIELTDENLIKEIKICEQKYYDDDYGYIYFDELTETVSKIFFTIVFAVIPAVVFVISLVFAIKSKKALYKKLLYAACGISLAEIVTFIYIAFTLFNT